MEVQAMENKEFEQQMESLKKSFERIPTSFDSNDVLRKIEMETIQSSKKKSSKGKGNMIRQKATVWAVSIASVFIIGFLTATFLYTEKNEQAGEGEITEQFLLQLEESYNAERMKKQEI